MKPQLRGTVIATIMLLVFLLASGTPVDAAGNTEQVPVFSDVTSAETAAAYINYMAQRGIISGFPDGTFQPGATVTRAQMAQMLVKSNTMKVQPGPAVQFTDVKPDHWAYKAVNSAVQSGFIAGYPDGTFRPEAPATRAEVASMLLRLNSASLPDAAPSSGVRDLGSHWALSSCAVVLDAGIMNLASEGLFAPDNPATRADVARGLALMLTLSPDQNQVSLTGTLVPQGQVQIQRANGSIIDVTSASPCSQGDTIVTGSNATAELNFPDGSGLKIKENTRLIIKEAAGSAYIMHNGQPGTMVDKLELELPQGEIFGALASSYHNNINTDENEEPSITGMIQDNHSLLASLNLPSALAAGTEKAELPWYQQSSRKKVRVKVDMPWGVAAIRGTFWGNLVNPSGSGSTSVLTGSCEVTAGGQTVMVPPGQSTGSTGPGSPPSPPAPMPPQQQQQWNQEQQWVQQTAGNIQDGAPLPPGPPSLLPGPPSPPSGPPPAGIAEQILNNIRGAMPQFGSPPPPVSSSSSDGGSHTPAYIAVSSTDPVNGAQNVSVEQSITVTFDRTVSAGTGYADIELSTESEPVDATVSLNANVLTVTPSQPLSYDRTYTLTVPAAAVRDSNQYILNSALILNFTTLSSSPLGLSVQSTTPLDSATGVAVNQVITVNFNQAIFEGQGYSDISLGNMEFVEPGIEGSVLTIIPAERLAYNSSYTLTIPYNALMDSSGNVMSGNFTLSFTTGNTSPPPEPEWITIRNNATINDEVVDKVEVDTIPVGTIAKVYNGNGNLLGSGAAEDLGNDGYMPAQVSISNGFPASLTSVVVTITEPNRAESEGTEINLPTPVMNEGLDYEVDNCDHGYGKITYILTNTQKTAIETATGKIISTVKAYTAASNEETFTDLATAELTGGVEIPITDNDNDTDDYISVSKSPGNYGYAIAAYDELNQVVAYYISDTWVTVWAS